jgi:hypothetical protein
MQPGPEAFGKPAGFQTICPAPLSAGFQITGPACQSRPESPRVGRARFEHCSGIPEHSGTQSISIAMPWVRRARALRLIRLANRCPGPGSRCAVRRMAACESLKIATVFTPLLCCGSFFLIVSPNASPIAHNLASKTTIRPVPR